MEMQQVTYRFITQPNYLRDCNIYNNYFEHEVNENSEITKRNVPKKQRGEIVKIK